MNLENSQYLFELYDHCKDFRDFFLNSDYHNMFYSLIHILKQIIEIDNIGGIFYQRHQNTYEYFTVFQNDYDEDFISFYHSLPSQQTVSKAQIAIQNYLKQYQHLYIFPLYSGDFFYGYLYFTRDLKKADFNDEDKDFFKSLSEIYADIFGNKENYQRKVFDQSIVSRILNSIHANVCITDPYTSTLLYVNDKMKETYHIDDQAIGLKCYDVLQNSRHCQCQKCPIHYLLEHPQECFMWEDMNEASQHVYQNYDSFIEWFDHSLVHLQYSVDITQMRLIQNEASYDELTGAYNRRFGKIQLVKQIKDAQQENKNIIVCLFDLDHLKATNDAFGHISGDVFLKTIADEVISTIHKEDIFLRLSGDEFIVSFYDFSYHQAHDTMESILRQLKAKQIKEHIPFELSFCYGLYKVTPNNQMELNEIIHQADEKMYTWKKRNHLKEALHQLSVSSPIAEKFDYNKDLLYDALVKSTDDYIFVCNMKTGVFKYTPEMVKEFHFPSEVLTNAAAVFGSKIHKDDKYEFLNNNQQITDGRVDSHIVEYRALNKDNEYVWLRCRGHVEYDENGEASLFAGFISNLGRKNYRDILTGLYNQFEFEKRIEETQSRFAIMMLNISHFQAINQLYDHEFGDNVIRIIAQNLQTMFHKDSTVFKLDGDEFGLIIKDCSFENIHSIYQKIQSFANQEHHYEDKPFTISFNAGVAIYPQDGHDYLELRKNCEIALQYSRRNTQNILTFFKPDLLKEKTYHLQLLNCLKQSIYNQFDGFSLVFQPKVASITHDLMGFEALIRWNHPDFPHTGPGFFIPLLEETGDIVQLGAWIFEQSLTYLELFREYHPDIFISINVSYIQLIQKHFIDFVKSTLEKHPVPPHQIIIELTETAIAKNTDYIVPTIIQLQELGINIAMDDFGTGYSSLSLLRDEPLNIIKIDQSFVRNIKNDAYNYAFTKFMIELCHQLQLKVVIEGVETQEELEIVENFHPDFIQGYYTGRPMTINQVLAMLEDHFTNDSKQKNIDN